MSFLSIMYNNIAAVTSETSPLTLPEIKSEYADLFTGYGKFDGLLHLETDSSVVPVRMPLRRLLVAVRNKVKSELDEMVANDIIAPVIELSEWISALLVVAKGNGSLRICMDPKPLNKALLRNHYLMPTIDDVLPSLTSAKVFSTVDAAHAFWHVQLDEESSKLTTFETPFGRYRWLRLPLGISVASEEFQRRLHENLTGLKGIAVIADDILVYGTGETTEEATMDHDNNLRELFSRARACGLRLNLDKMKLRQTSISYMGHMITSEGLKPDPSKIEALKKMPPPTDVKGVQRLLGMATYLAKFVPQFSEMTSSIRTLLDKNNEFHWSTENEREFENLKALLSSDAV